HREGNGRLLAGSAILDFEDVDGQAGELGRVDRRRVRAYDGRVIFLTGCRDVALRAQLVVGLRQVDVILAGGEVDVVMAGSASRPVGIGVPCVRLGRARVLLVAALAPDRAGEGAAATVGGELNRGPVAGIVPESDNVILAACHD